MSGILEINEREAWMPAGWIFDRTLEQVGNELLEQDRDLATIFLEGGTEISGGFLSLKSLSGIQMQLFLEALKAVHKRTIEKGSQAFSDPSFYPGYLTKVAELVHIVERDRRLAVDQ